jgi:hypothetical protein
LTVASTVGRLCRKDGLPADQKDDRFPQATLVKPL